MGFQVQEGDRGDNRITMRSFSNSKRTRIDTEKYDSQMHLCPKGRADLRAKLFLLNTPVISSCLLNISREHLHQQLKSNCWKTNWLFPSSHSPYSKPVSPICYFKLNILKPFSPPPFPHLPQSIGLIKFNYLLSTNCVSGILVLVLKTQTRKITGLPLDNAVFQL